MRNSLIIVLAVLRFAGLRRVAEYGLRTFDTDDVIAKCEVVYAVSSFGRQSEERRVGSIDGSKQFLGSWRLVEIQKPGRTVPSGFLHSPA